MDSFSDIWKYAPKTWVLSYDNHNLIVTRESTEFKEIEYDIKMAVRHVERVVSITRVQNFCNYGQFLMRSRILATDNPYIEYYMVRRYVAIPTSSKLSAIKYNLDHRRLDINELAFCSHLPYVGQGFSIFVVIILTTNKKERNIVPYNFTDYYIEYVVDIDVSNTF